MTLAVPSGWGGAPWGLGPWGSGAPALALLSAQAVSENVVRARFSAVPLFERLGTPSDAASPKRFSVTAVSGVGLDGEPVRPVLPVRVDVAEAPGAAGTALDVTLDRPMSAWPCIYRLSANNLVSVDGAWLDPGASFEFPAVLAGIIAPVSENAFASVDLLMAESVRDLIGVVPGATSANLGKLVADSTGDYASGSPLASYRTRVVRRLLAAVGAFMHMSPRYGAGLAGVVKQPGRGGDIERLCAIAEEQVRGEPETVSVRVTAEETAQVFFFRVRAVAKFGPAEFDVPVRKAA